MRSASVCLARGRRAAAETDGLKVLIAQVPVRGCARDPFVVSASPPFPGPGVCSEMVLESATSAGPTASHRTAVPSSNRFDKL